MSPLDMRYEETQLTACVGNYVRRRSLLTTVSCMQTNTHRQSQQKVS